MGGGHEGQVKLLLRPGEILSGPNGPLHFSGPVGNVLDFLVGAPQAGQPGRLRFHHHADFKQIPQPGMDPLQALQANVPGPVQYKGAAAPPDLQEALGGQGAHGLPQGGPADAEQGAELLLPRQPGSGAVGVAGAQHSQQAVGCLICQFLAVAHEWSLPPIMNPLCHKDVKNASRMWFSFRATAISGFH